MMGGSIAGYSLNAKKEKPTIGFVGNADGSFSKWMKEALIYSKQTLNRLLKKDFTDKQVFFPSSSVRFRLLEKIKASGMIHADFVYRNKYRWWDDGAQGGAGHHHRTGKTA